MRNRERLRNGTRQEFRCPSWHTESLDGFRYRFSRRFVNSSQAVNGYANADLRLTCDLLELASRREAATERGGYWQSRLHAPARFFAGDLVERFLGCLLEAAQG